MLPLRVTRGAKGKDGSGPTNLTTWCIGDRWETHKGEALGKEGSGARGVIWSCQCQI